MCAGSIQIDGVTYDHDAVIDGGRIRKRKKKPTAQAIEELAKEANETNAILHVTC